MQQRGLVQNRNKKNKIGTKKYKIGTKKKYKIGTKKYKIGTKKYKIATKKYTMGIINCLFYLFPQYLGGKGHLGRKGR